MGRKRFLFSYDISDDDRRTKVFKTLRDHGDHVQYSVFLCELNTRELAALRERLTPMIHQLDDQLIVLDMGAVTRDLSASLEVMGKPYSPPVRVQVV